MDARRERTDAWLRSLEEWQWDAVRAALDARRPSLHELPDDVLLCVLRCLAEPSDRLAFATALLPRTARRWSCGTPFTTVAALEHAVLRTCDAIRAVADASLYALYLAMANYPLSPSMSKRVLVVADWSVFTSRWVEPLAHVSWSGRGPHARCDVNVMRVREHVRGCLRRGCSSTRLSAIPVEPFAAWFSPSFGCVARVRVSGVPQSLHRHELTNAMVCFYVGDAARMRRWFEDADAHASLECAENFEKRVVHLHHKQ